MYKLFYSPGACSMAVHVALNECGAKFDVVDVSQPGMKDPGSEFLKANPNGAVPTLMDDGLPIREGGAILTYLCDKEKSPLLPASGPERATALSWLMWCNATLHPAYGKVFWTMKKLKDQPALQQQLFPMFIAGIQEMWDEAEARLAQSPFLAGPQITIGDILLTVIANWNGYLPQPVNYGPNTKRLLQQVSARPAYQKALAAEGVEYKAAA